MISAGQASLWEVLDGFLWSNRYRAMAATPLSPAQIATGLGAWHATRTLIGVTGVAVALAMFADTRTWGVVAAIPVAVLCGLAFALPLSAWSATRYGGASFPSIIRFGLLPMFLLGGAFFPIDQLPDWLEPVAYVTPLWHAIELCRGFVIAAVDPGNVAVHLAVISIVRGRRMARLSCHLHPPADAMTDQIAADCPGRFSASPIERVCGSCRWPCSRRVVRIVSSSAA